MARPATQALPAESTDVVVAEVVRRLVAGFRPARIVLFGSRGRGDARPDSDYDFVVVMRGPVAARDEIAMRLALRGIRAAFDLVVVAEPDWAKWSAVPLTLEHRIACEGRVVFDDRG